jgi:RNA polymerase sigma-70 factor (ECF subfamily)
VSSAPGAEPTDDELIRRFRAGDHEAFANLVRRHERRVYNLAYRMIGRAEDARDVTQETFLSCFRKLDSFRGDSAFSTWLYRIAANATYDTLRRKTPVPLASEDLVPPPAPDLAETASTAIDVQRALMLVPHDFRAVLVMHDVQGYPYEDIAEVLELPLGTVKSRLHRARVALGRALSGEPGAGPGPSKPTTPSTSMDPDPSSERR